MLDNSALGSVISCPFLVRTESLTVDLVGTMESGPNNVQPPHPELRNKSKVKTPVRKKGVFGR